MNRLFLVGFMGAGKSTLGTLLAERWACPFLDLDHVIERREGRSIATIFAEHGEAYFRELETRTLRQVSADQAGVIALGGGTFVSAENRNIVQAAGVSVYLDIPFDVVWQRVGVDPDRPLATSRAQMEARFSARLASYRRADMCWQPEEALHCAPQILAEDLGSMIEAERPGLFAPAPADKNTAGAG